MRIIEKELGKKLRKPVCAYSLFVKQRRHNIQAANPELDHVGVMKMLSTQWKQLSADELKLFQDLAEEDKVRYEEDCIEFKKEFEKKEMKQLA